MDPRAGPRLRLPPDGVRRAVPRNRDVMSNFFVEIERCIRRGIEYDLFWNLEDLKLTGYREIVNIREDGKVEITNGGKSELLDAARVPVRPDGAPPRLTVNIITEIRKPSPASEGKVEATGGKAMPVKSLSKGAGTTTTPAPPSTPEGGSSGTEYYSSHDTDTERAQQRRPAVEAKPQKEAQEKAQEEPEQIPQEEPEEAGAEDLAAAAGGLLVGGEPRTKMQEEANCIC